MQYQDQTLKCRDCGESFVFSIRDQQFWAERGFTNPPSRCKDCRQKKKESGGRTPAAATSGEPKTLYRITCKNCGKVGEMAIEPRKPDDVLCSECFYDLFKKELASKERKEPAKAAASDSSENSSSNEA
jgi:CxxC-x17-CxxC domain-containing protein